MSEVNFSLLGLYAIAVWSLLVTPGPVTLLVIRSGLSGGMKQAFQTICGTNLASLVLIFLSVLLINGVLVVGDNVFAILRLLGCFYIIWMAYGMLLDSLKNTADLAMAENITPASAGFVRGFVLAISNPKDMIFFASFFPQFINVLPSQNSSLSLLTLVWIILDFATLLSLTYIIKFVASAPVKRKLELFSSALLLLIGVGGAVYAMVEIYHWVFAASSL